MTSTEQPDPDRPDHGEGGHPTAEELRQTRRARREPGSPPDSDHPVDVARRARIARNT